eukprot:m.1192164 g.1192164  ORF g.1192164 m.1192164 type:complete len:188 (-) comp24556_c1_seq125:2626-3189(-)
MGPHLPSHYLGYSDSDSRLTQYIHELRDVSDVSGDVKKNSKSFGKTTRYDNYPQLGVQLAFENNILDCIHVFNAGIDGFARSYGGMIGNGISMTSTNADVVKELGEPPLKGGGPHIRERIWISYPKLGIQVNFDSQVNKADPLCIHFGLVSKESDWSMLCNVSDIYWKTKALVSSERRRKKRERIKK